MENMQEPSPGDGNIMQYLNSRESLGILWNFKFFTSLHHKLSMSSAPWPQPMFFILPQLKIQGVHVSKLRKATGKLVHHGSLHCVACHHEIAKSIEGLIQVFDLDEKPFQDNVYTSQTKLSQKQTQSIDIYWRQTRKHRQTHTHTENTTQKLLY